MRLNTAAILGTAGLLLASGLIMLGALLPWAKGPFGISKAGIEGDGAFTLLGGVLMAVAATLYLVKKSDGWRWTSLGLAVIISGFVLVVTVADYRDLQRIIASDGLITAGSGIYLSMIAGGLGLASALLAAFGATVSATDEWEVDETSYEPDSSPRGRLRQLHQLQLDGLITDEQFAERQRRILDEI